MGVEPVDDIAEIGRRQAEKCLQPWMLNPAAEAVKPRVAKERFERIDAIDDFLNPEFCLRIISAFLAVARARVEHLENFLREQPLVGRVAPGLERIPIRHAKENLRARLRKSFSQSIGINKQGSKNHHLYKSI